MFRGFAGEGVYAHAS